MDDKSLALDVSRGRQGQGMMQASAMISNDVQKPSIDQCHCGNYLQYALLQCLISSHP